MSTTVYKPGDRLFERTTYVDANYHASDIVREWTVLAVVVDDMHVDEKEQPQQVVTLRAFTPKRVIYLAEIALFLDIKVTHGTWHRTEAEARATLAANKKEWSG